MRTMRINKRPLYYCLYSESEITYDEYGNESGYRPVYAEPVIMYANVSQATGQSNTEMFGNLENYDKVIVTDDLNCPIDENTVLFVDKEPEFSVTDGDPLYDYTVRRVAKSLNSISIAIRKVQTS